LMRLNALSCLKIGLFMRRLQTILSRDLDKKNSCQNRFRR
jgi:hypothetical protein